MHDVTLDRAAAILRSGARIAMSTVALDRALRPGDARSLESDAGASHVATLERRLRDDDRFIILDSGSDLPGLDSWAASDREAYAPALRHLDLPRPPLVLLREAPASGPLDARPIAMDALARLLHHTVLDLAAAPSAAAIARAAEEAREAMATLNHPTHATAPSTSHPPGPPPPA